MAFRIVCVTLALCAAVQGAVAQEMEPRAFSPSPMGTRFVGVAFGTSSGDVLLDPTVPITDVHANILQMGLAYGRSFGLAGRGGLWTVVVPLAYAHVDGMVAETARSVRRDGLADVRLRASINLIGGKAMTAAEFRTAPRSTVVGVALTVQAPSGEYDPVKLINLGTHRWAYKPEVGVSVPIGAWTLEGFAGAWFFTSNDSYFPGESIKRQDPLTSLQGHVAYTFKPRTWLALDATWYGGGEVTIDDKPPSARFSNSRLGATLAIPVTPRQSLKLAGSHGTQARLGSNFTTYAAAWQFVWLAKQGQTATP